MSFRLPLSVAGVVVVAALLVVSVRPVVSGMALNDFVNHFEPLFYDDDNVRLQHGRSKRSDGHDHLHVQFTAHNRIFKIRLRRSSDELFAEDALLESTRGPVSFDMAKIYRGQLEDDELSTVSAVLTSDGYLDASVTTATETYYVEPSSRYFANASFPAVIYKESDVTLHHPGADADADHDHHQCASHQLYLKEFERQNCLYSANNKTAVIDRCHRPTVGTAAADDLNRLDGIDPNQLIDRTLYSGWTRTSGHQHDARRKKKRRSSGGGTIDARKTTCMLYLQADHLFYAKMGSEEACIEAMTRHVQRVNTIYKNIDFDGDGRPDDVNFMIKRIKVHTEQALNEASYRFPGNYGVEKFLELFSEEDYNAFCLAYMFTYRDFEGGTLGLAWTGDLKNAGGVCEKNGHYRGSLKSLNTGIVTLLNYGKHVPPAVSHVTLAHEIGHNFGSPHDPENNRECTPGGEDGNYIMFARATSGDKRNNNKFSPCSLKSINAVLGAKARSEHGCFTEPQSSICGNGVVEAGEECDCGWEEDCQEKCCTPMRSTQLAGEKPCTLRPGRVCSPSQGPCCTDDCQLRYGAKCRDDNGCRDSAYCDGSGPKCPLSSNKPNKTVCNEEFVCFMGECTGSICIAYGLQSCQCLQGPNDPPTKACELCCKLPGDDQPCMSSFEWNTPPYDVPDAHAKAGTPCNNYNGYCDVFQRCREVDPSGPLATLRRLLLSDESIASLKKWIQDHWYGVLFIAVGFITVIVVVARVFGKRVRQKMQRQRQQQRASRTTNGVTTAAAAAATAAEVDETADQHIVHPVAIRTKIPLKRKVREKEKRAGRKAQATSRAIDVFLRPNRKHRQQKPAGERHRRSGVVSTKEKVRSWLERENPTNRTVDSDNESQFPDDDDHHHDHNQKDQTKSNGSSSSNLRQLTHSQPNLAALSSTTEPARVKMMRSISTVETVREREAHHFARSISHHGHHHHHETPPVVAEFGRRLSRKTESHSHLLSKSELDVVGHHEPDERIDADDAIQPAVADQPPPKRKISKSATESHLKGRAEPPTSVTQRLSSDLLHMLTRKFTSPATLANGANTEAQNKPPVSAPANGHRKVGLGPVKVVLKWHGGGAGRSKPKDADGGKKRSRKSNKKRVIVYKNGNPTPGRSAVAAVAAASVPAVAKETVIDTAVKRPTKDEVNITLNPLEEPAHVDRTCRSNRRFSMAHQDRPPTLMRRVSEVHYGGGPYANQRRNRHSWTSPCTLPESLQHGAATGQIRIDIDPDEEC